MGQTVAQGAQNSASVKTTQRVVAQDLLKPVIPPVIPPVVPDCPDYARRAGSHRDLCDCHPRAFHHQHGPEPRTLSHRRLRRKRRLPRLADPRLSKWGLNPDGTPATTSRQFQAGLSVTGKGLMQNATLFVMTSAISNAPNVGFTQAGGFTGVTMRNHDGWYGLAGGSVLRRRRRRRPTLCRP